MRAASSSPSRSRTSAASRSASAAGGQQVGLPPLLTLDGRAFEVRVPFASGLELGLKPLGLIPQPLDLARQRCPLLGHRTGLHPVRYRPGPRR